MAKKAEPFGHLTTYFEATAESLHDLERYRQGLAFICLVLAVIVATLLVLWLS